MKRSSSYLSYVATSLNILFGFQKNDYKVMSEEEGDIVSLSMPPITHETEAAVLFCH